MVGLILAAPLLLLLIIALLCSMVRGVIKSRIRLIIVAVCLIIAFLIAINVTPALRTAFEENKDTIAEQIGSDKTTQELWDYINDDKNSGSNLADVVLQIGAAILAPFVFLIAFTALRFLTWIIYFIVMIALRKKIKPKEAMITRVRILRALAYGLVQFLLIAFVFLTPIYVIAQCLDTAVVLSESMPTDETASSSPTSIIEEYHLDTVKKNPLLVTYGALGGKAISGRITQIKIGDEKTNLIKELQVLPEIVESIQPLMGGKGLDEFGEEQANAIEKFADSFTKSKILTSVLGEIVYGATGSWIEGNAFMGTEAPSLGGEGNDAASFIQPLLNTLLQDLHNDANPKNGTTEISKDLKTVAKILKIMVKDGILSGTDDPEKLINTLGSGSTVSNLIAAIGENDNLRNLIPEFTNIGMRAIGTLLSLPENPAAVYDNFINDIAAALYQLLQNYDLTDDATIEELTAAINKAMKDSEVDIELDAALVKLYAETILDDLKQIESKDDLTEADIQEFVKEFFEIYTASTTTDDNGTSSGVAYFFTTKSGATSILLESGEKVFTSKVYRGKTLTELKKKSAAGLLAAITSDIAKESKNTEQSEESFQAAVSQIMRDRTAEYAEATGNTEKANALCDKLVAKVSEISVTSITVEVLSKTADLTPESFPTVIVTVKDLLIDTAAATDKINSEEAVQKEADAISTIFSSAFSIKDKIAEEGLQVEDVVTITQAVGEILDSLSQTNSIGEEGTAKIVTAVFQSKTVTETLNLDIKSATELAKQATSKGEGEEKVNYADTMSSIGKGVMIAEKISSSTQPITYEEIEEMLANMTPQTAKMLGTYMTVERVKGYGIPEGKEESATALLKNLFVQMEKKDTYGEEGYQKQTAAIHKIFVIANDATKAESAKNFFNSGDVAGRSGMTAEETIEIFMQADMVVNAALDTLVADGAVVAAKINPLGLNIPEGSADYQACVAAIRSYYETQQDQNDTLKLKLNAVAALFGVSPIL